MRCVLNGPLKNYRNKRHTDKTRTKLTETTLLTPTSIHTNKKQHQNKVEQNLYFFRSIVLRAFTAVETAALTFRTKQYSTSCSSHICYGKRFCNDFFSNHNTIALVLNCLTFPLPSLLVPTPFYQRGVSIRTPYYLKNRCLYELETL